MNGSCRALASEEAAVRAPDEASPSRIDLPAAERAVRSLLEALGEDPRREGLLDTPRRVAKALSEMTAGRFEDPAVILSRTFEQECDQPVILRDIAFNSLCEHHLLPFTGKAHVAYLPGDGRVVGLSKLARLVDTFARRPQLQEQMTNQIADALATHLHAKAVAVIVEGEHMCMKLRGVAKNGATMRTLAMRGDYQLDRDARMEILSLLRG
ncbi:MAG: GTP cyclohydrolase I FolE [Phycisphaeraceae bacterium]|nr:GTP cyclohydrolase I FolE [Phycisphaeraceae bacterium]